MEIKMKLIAIATALSLNIACLEASFDAPTLVSQEGRLSGRPQLATDGHGQATVIFMAKDYPGCVLQAATCSNGHWASPVEITHSFEEFRSWNFALDVGGNGGAIWLGQRDEGLLLQAAVCSSDGEWADAVD